MNKIIITLSILLAYVFSYAQNAYPIKEHYDKLYYNTNHSPLNFDYTNCTATGNKLSWVLSSLISMFETTGDKAYLVKFMNHCIQLQSNRRDEIIFFDAPVWIRNMDDLCDGKQDDKEPAYFNSLLIYPMAKFVNMVIQNPDLYNTNLPIQPYTSQNIVDITTLNSMNPGFPVIGYGDFANWLGKRVEETIFYMNNNYWDYSFGIKSHFSEDLPADMNMQAPYGSALLFMGLANTNFGYGNNRATFLYQAQIIAGRIKGSVDIDGCNASYHFPVLRTMSNGNNAYFWYHRGWRLEKDNCFLATDKPSVAKYVELVEDVSHGAMDLWFVKACYDAQLAPCNTCTPYFTFSEMELFRNTLTKNIYYTNATGSHFHNTVNGTDNGFAGDENCTPNCPTDLMWGEVLDWMPVYQFDGNSTPNAYDIILNHTIGVISTPSTQNLTGAQSYLGLSEVVKAQWDKECVSLTLYNRKNVYDQDFNVKNKIIVAPQQVDIFHQLNANSFADPLIADNKFTIEPNVTVNMVAGERIELLPGFETKTGANFTASINSSACTDGFRMGNSNGNSNESRTYNSLSATIPMDSSFIISTQPNIINNTPTNSYKIYPSPNSGLFTIELENTNSSNFIEIYDVMGKKVCSKVAFNNKTEIDISNQPKGIYLVKWINGNNVTVQKIVFQ